jgi:hypothetical protein
VCVCVCVHNIYSFEIAQKVADSIEIGGPVVADGAVLVRLSVCSNKGDDSRRMGCLRRSIVDPIERLAGGLAQCTALAHLNLGCNDIKAGGAERLAEVLGQSAGSP